MIAAATIDDWRQLMPGQLTHASPAPAGAPLLLRQYRIEQDARFELPAIAEHLLWFAAGRPLVVEHQDAGRVFRRTYPPGEGRILPAGTSASGRVIGPGTAIHLYMSPDSFNGVAAADFGGTQRPVSLLQPLRLRDPFLWTFAAGFLRRTRLGPVLDRMTLDAAALGLACYLIGLRSCGTDARRAGAQCAGRSPARVADFIDDGVACEFGLDELASAIGVPERSLLRSFVGADLKQLRRQVRHVRIRRAGAYLRHSPIALGDVARASGFKDGAALDVASYFAYGCTAAELRDASACAEARAARRGGAPPSGAPYESRSG